MTVTRKLIVAFGTVFVIIALFGLYILYAFESLRYERSNIRDWVESVSVVSKIDKQLDKIHRQVYQNQVPELGEADNLFAEYQIVLNKCVYNDEKEKQADQAMLDNEKKLWTAYKSNLTEENYKKISDAMREDVAQCEEGLRKAVDVSENTFAEFENLIELMGIIIGLILVIVLGVLYFLARDIKGSVTDIVAITESAAQGNLRQELTVTSSDEFGTIAGQVNSVLKNMRVALRKVLGSAQEVTASAEKMKGGVSETGELLEKVAVLLTEATDHTKVQKASVAESEERIKQMESSVGQSIAAMKAGLWSLEQTAEFAYRGMEMSDATVKKMNEIARTVNETEKIVVELGETSKQIVSIVEVTSSIAEQTNLLALNAAIEAARAGEQGKGFAVVADEVRKLAESSQQSVQKIGDIVDSIQATTAKAIERMGFGHKLVQEGEEEVVNTGASFHEIVNMLQQTDENSQQVMMMISNLDEPIKDIVERTKKITSMSADIADKMEQISIATAKQAENIMEISDDSASLLDLSGKMKSTVEEFQL